MKTPLIVLALLVAFHPLPAHSLDLGQPVSGSPYEIYMENVKNVLHAIKGRGASMDRAEALMREGCTRNNRPAPANKVARSEYIPLYSYGGNGVSRHEKS